MKNLAISEQFKKTGLVVALEIVVALLISGLLIFGVILPQYRSWQKTASENKETADRLEKVSKNVETLSSLKASEYKELSEALALVLPAEADLLRFVSLAENVAAVSGVRLSAAQVQLGGSGTSVVTSPTVGSTSKPTPSAGTGSSSGGATPVSQRATASTKGLAVKLSFEGSYSVIFTYIANFGRADRAAVISDLSLSSGGEEGKITATLEFSLPLFAKAAAASAENFAQLSSGEKQFLSDLLDKIEITAKPAKEPLGKEDPFR